MKRVIFFILLFVVTITAAQSPDIELAIRFIKLGNTYREGKEFDNSAKFLNEGLKIARKSNSFDGKYWTAASYEGLGYLYRDMAMYNESKENFKKAIDIYNQIIKQENGSQIAMLAVLNKLARINSEEISESRAVSGLNGTAVALTDRKLKELPSDIPLGTKNLILKDNRFRNFPEGLIQFKNLEYLDLSNNRLRNISSNIGALKNLHYLDLSSNRIAEIPSGISELLNLRELNLSGNKLKDINFNVCALKNLKLLNLQNNKLDFQEVLKLVKCLPNTNIIFDKYEKIDDESEEEEDN
ncbi:MAG: leucine-rich repeat domain-containing protein [Candidatus Kapabacteria bacterium]|nr:leucine-rich repeat domain-containing protein [Ignavibacteriota bacterium]MCW5884161.1 leucine-rich repeat domain-containing protein [Candidatus Kapabacteria bacterium]